jgi:hypothetical protein
MAKKRRAARVVRRKRRAPQRARKRAVRVTRRRKAAGSAFSRMAKVARQLIRGTRADLQAVARTSKKGFGTVRHKTQAHAAALKSEMSEWDSVVKLAGEGEARQSVEQLNETAQRIFRLMAAGLGDVAEATAKSQLAVLQTARERVRQRASDLKGMLRGG